MKYLIIIVVLLIFANISCFAWNFKPNKFNFNVKSIDTTSNQIHIENNAISNTFCKFFVCSVFLFSQLEPSYAMHVPVASKYFEQAEESIEATQRSYKALESEWSEAKKALMEINKDIVYAKESLSATENDLIKLETKVIQAFESDKSAIKSIESEIEALRISTAEKYQIAEDASAANAKPSQIAKLFENAQNEATLLIEVSKLCIFIIVLLVIMHTVLQDEKLLKEFCDIEENANVLLRKSGDAVRSLQDSLKALVGAETEQLEGYNLLTDGIASSSKKFEGRLLQ